METPNFTGQSPETSALESTLSKNAQSFYKLFVKAVNSDEQKELLSDYCKKIKKNLKSKELIKNHDLMKKHYAYALKVWMLDKQLSVDEFKKVWKSQLPLP